MLSTFGDTAMLLVAGIWVKQLTGSDSLAALVQVCVWGPTLFGPLLGRLVDRFPRRAFLVALNLVMAALLPALFLVREERQVWVVFAVMVLYGANYVLSGAAEPALLSLLVPAEALGGLHGVRMAVAESCKLLAPAVGAGLFAWQGAPPVVALDAATFVAAAVLLTRVRVVEPPRKPEDGAEREWWRRNRPGRRPPRATARLGDDPVLRRVVPAAAVALVGCWLRQPMLFAVVDEGLGRPATFLGVLTTLQGAGSVAAGLSTGWATRRWGEVRTVVLGMLVASVGVLLSLPPWTPAVALSSLLWGFGVPWILAGALTLVQVRTAPAVQGRMVATATSLLYGSNGPVMVLATVLLARTHHAPPLAVTGLLGLAATAWVFPLARRRGRRERTGRQAASPVVE
ncbi:MFS transporter [Allostreptomyces psammosilenae]|uniref:Putative MFS family arabinose efflux permease n=1 Tax=Allostreptomyces psammosilenae TaxID=1892865 RepID=A0A852ZQI9_9ACTN|nr:MFS transporter [Allostreptomyces psammosilenae]NYI03540.1 putative MFS family arabinose efflux permease [Allostreptomyces psammosilenae]